MASLRRTLRGSRWRVALVAAAAAGAVGLGALLGSSVVDDPTDGVQPARGAPAAEPLPSGFVRHRDDLTGVSFAYPRSWRELGSRERDVRFVASNGRGGSMLLRATEVGFEVRGPRGVAKVRDHTDRAVMSNDSVRLIAEPRQVELGGLPGWFYLYTFRDGRRRGAHSHYVVFRGRTMFALVFQALPAARFERLAPLFDQVASSFRATP